MNRPEIVGEVLWEMSEELGWAYVRTMIQGAKMAVDSQSDDYSDYSLLYEIAATYARESDQGV
jgi:hypothetical protein